MTTDQSSPIGASSVQEVDQENEKTNTYSQQLKDNKWYAKRKIIIVKANYKCQHCGIGGKLDVHHLYYIKGKKAWQHPNKALIALCRDCHYKWHRTHRLEYREEVWKGNEIYQVPENRKVYYVTKGRKVKIRKERPYHSVKKVKKVISFGSRMLTPLEKAKKKHLQKARKFKQTIPETITRPDGVVLYTNQLTDEQIRVFMKKYCK